MIKVIAIGFGGAIGAITRYGVSGWAYSFAGTSFPWGTFIVNMIGSLLIGLCAGIVEEVQFSDEIKMFVFVGLLGSFTTFSTFSYKNFQMIQEGEYGLIAANVGGSIILGLAMVFVGMMVARTLMTALR